jgi:CBS domain-containing protein
MEIWQILARKGKNVVTARPEQTVRDAVSLLVKHQIGALIITDSDEHPVGILSERDIIHRAAENETLFSESIDSLMTKNIIVGTPQDDTYSVAATMTENRFRHLPIMEQDRLIGIVSIGDILKAERDQYRGEVDTLETVLMADDM